MHSTIIFCNGGLKTAERLYPYSRVYLAELQASSGAYWHNHFSTIGIVGLNEACVNLIKVDIGSERGKRFAVEVLDYIRKRMVDFQEETGHLYNLEATPAEGTTYRFAKEDQKRYGDILQAGTKARPYYTNSSQLPVGFTDDPFEALIHQDELQTQYTGGTVLHLYMGERITNAEACKQFVRRALEKFRLPYITITPTFSVCPIHGYLKGEYEFCPTCDEEAMKKKAQRNGGIDGTQEPARLSA